MSRRSREPLPIFSYVWRFAFGLCLGLGALIVLFLAASGSLSRLWTYPILEFRESAESEAHRFQALLSPMETGATLYAAATAGSFSRKGHAEDPGAYLEAFLSSREPALRALASLPHVDSAALLLGGPPQGPSRGLLIRAREGGGIESERGSWSLPLFAASSLPEWSYEPSPFPGSGDSYALYVPVVEGSEALGTLRISCDPRWISEELSSLGSDGEGSTLLADRDGLLLAQSPGPLSDLDARRLSVMASGDSFAPLPGGELPVRLLSLDGARYYASRVDLPSGLRIVKAASFGSLRTPFLAGAASLIGLLAVSLLAALLLSYLIGRFVTRPLANLASVSAAVLSGKPGELSAASGPLEVRQLAESLDRAISEAAGKTREQQLLIDSNARIDLLSIDLDAERVASLNGFGLFGVEGVDGTMDFHEWVTRFHIVLLERNFNPLLSPGYQERSGLDRAPREMLRELAGMEAGATTQREFSFDTLKGEEGFMRVNALRASRGLVMAACVDMTEEYRTRRELFVLSTRLSHALNATQSVAIFDVSFDTMELWASDSFFPFFEIDKPPAGILLLPDFEKRLAEGPIPLLDPSQGYAPADFWGKGSRVFRLSLPRSGVSRWIEVRTAETVRGTIGTVIDITRQVLEKQAALERADSAQELSRVILSALTEAVLGMGREGHCVFMNPAAEVLLGYSQEELVGQDLRPVFSPMDASGRPNPGAEFRLERVLDDHAPSSSEHERFRRKDGSLYQASIRVQPLMRGDEFFGAVATLVDVSGLVELSNRFGAILANAVDQIHMTDRELRLTMVSDSFLKAMGGAGIDSVLGRPMADFLPPSLADGYRATESRVLESGEPARDIVMNLPYSGGSRWMNMAIIPLRDAQGETIGVFGIARDVTEAFRLDEELRAAKTEADRANRAKSLFLAGMSHEIRTPLNAILGYSQLMAGSPDLGPDQLRMIGTISRSGEHLLDLINSILEISKIEAGRIAPFLAAADLFRLLSDIESMFRIRTEAKGLAFEVVRGPGLPRWILTDVQKLRQILINLLGNAVKFTRKGEVRLEADSRDGKLSIEVSDTGPGIDDADKIRIFMPFIQGQAGIGSQGGTGLGLAISREYARLLGGDISIRDAAEGPGSVFRCELVLIPAAPSVAEDAASARTVAGLADRTASPLVLNADDSEENRALVRDILVPMGFRILEAKDGREALRAADDSRPDLVLMDIIMPGMDGIEAIERLRSAAKGPRLPIIAVSASAFEEDRRRVMAAGADDFIRKPMDREELLSKIGRALGLEYRYTEGTGSGQRARSAAVDLGKVPEGLRRELRKAAVELAPFQAAEVVKAIRELDPDAADGLSAMLERFDFQAVIGLLDGKGEKNG